MKITVGQQPPTETPVHGSHIIASPGAFQGLWRSTCTSVFLIVSNTRVYFVDNNTLYPATSLADTYVRMKPGETITFTQD